MKTKSIDFKKLKTVLDFFKLHTDKNNLTLNESVHLKREFEKVINEFIIKSILTQAYIYFNGTINLY